MQFGRAVMRKTFLLLNSLLALWFACAMIFYWGWPELQHCWSFVVLFSGFSILSVRFVSGFTYFVLKNVNTESVVDIIGYGLMFVPAGFILLGLWYVMVVGGSFSKICGSVYGSWPFYVASFSWVVGLFIGYLGGRSALRTSKTPT